MGKERNEGSSSLEREVEIVQTGTPESALNYAPVRKQSHLIRNILIGVIGVAVLGAVAYQLLNKLANEWAYRGLDIDIPM